LPKAFEILKGNNQAISGDPYELTFDNLTIDSADDERFQECDYCGSTLGKQNRCSKCKMAMYCNGDCQKQDWKRHKPLCARYTAAAV